IEDPDGGREVRRAQPGQEGGDGRIVLVVNQKIRFGDTLSQLDHLRHEATKADAPGSVAAEHERPAVFEHQGMIALPRLVGQIVKGSIVEYVAVLEDLDE